MASSTAESVFSSPRLANTPSDGGSTTGGAAAGGALGSLTGPFGAVVGTLAGGKAGKDNGGGFMGGVAGLDRSRLDEDPVRKAVDEQDAKYAAALEKAKDLKVTTTESGTTSTSGTTSGTSKTTFDPRSTEEQTLLDASMGAYADQKRLVDAQEAAILGRQGVQTGARDTASALLSGSAFNLSPDEAARIAGVRDSNIAAGSNAVNDILTQRLAEISADAARRGVRGQAFSQLQTGALGEAAKSLERTTLAANTDAANMAVSLPGQRAGIQASTAGQFAGFADELAQKAIENRAALQDPIALQQLRDERLKTGTTTQTGTTNETKKTDGTSVQTGGGQAEILAAQAGTPTKTGAQVGAMGTILGGVMGASG